MAFFTNYYLTPTETRDINLKPRFDKYKANNENENESVDFRTLLAIFCCLRFYFVFFAFFATAYYNTLLTVVSASWSRRCRRRNGS